MTATVEMPRLIKAREYAEAMGLSLHTVRHQLTAGTCEVPPAFVQPYRWRATEVKRHIETSNAAWDRARKAPATPRRQEAPDAVHDAK